MPDISSGLSVTPGGHLVLGVRSIYGEIHDAESGEALFIPRGGIKICGVAEHSEQIKTGALPLIAAWISAE